MKYERCTSCGTRAAWIGLAGNTILAALKILVGILAGSKALVADGFHSGGDAIGSIISIFSLRISNKRADESHPYGHGKIEFLFSLMGGTALALGGVVLTVDAIKALISGPSSPPHIIAAFAALLSIIVNNEMFRYMRCAGKQMNSPLLSANAAENRADALTSVPVLFGVIGAKFGYLTLDPLFAVAVSLLVIKAGVHLFMENLGGLLDVNLPATQVKKIANICREVPGVKGLGYVRTRQLGQEIEINVEVLVDGGYTVSRAYEITREVNHALHARFKTLSHAKVSFRSAPPSFSERGIIGKLLSPFRIFAPGHKEN